MIKIFAIKYKINVTTCIFQEILGAKSSSSAWSESTHRRRDHSPHASDWVRQDAHIGESGGRRNGEQKSLDWLQFAQNIPINTRVRLLMCIYPWGVGFRGLYVGIEAALMSRLTYLLVRNVLYTYHHHDQIDTNQFMTAWSPEKSPMIWVDVRRAPLRDWRVVLQPSWRHPWSLFWWGR